MDKKIIEKAKKLSINSDRLYDNREFYPVEWLLRKRCVSWGYRTKLEMITDVILEMNKNHPNYQEASAENKLKIEKLIENPEIVEMVIVSVFQWFGTNVGRCDIGELMDEIRALQYKQEKI